jgi:hypothetical protein
LARGTDRLSPAERTLRARLAAHSRWAKHDPVAGTAPARAEFLSRFERDADPDGTLPRAERARRAEHLRKAYFTKLALASARVRKNKSMNAKNADPDSRRSSETGGNGSSEATP